MSQKAWTTVDVLASVDIIENFISDTYTAVICCWIGASRLWIGMLANRWERQWCDDGGEVVHRINDAGRTCAKRVGYLWNASQSPP